MTLVPTELLATAGSLRNLVVTEDLTNMKLSFFIVIVAMCSINVQGQGEVSFSNDSATRVLIDKTPLGGSVMGVSLVDGIIAALYWAPLSDPNNFTQIGAAVQVGSPISGRYSGGTRTTGPATAPGEEARFQVRAWEAIYGSTFEEAIAAPIMNGRPACWGTSGIFQGVTGNPYLEPPGAPTGITTMGLTSFYVCIPEPSVIALGTLSAIASVLVYRRKY